MAFWNNFFLFFPIKQALIFHANCLLRRQFAWNVKACFLGKIKKTIINLASAEFAHRVVKKVKDKLIHLIDSTLWAGSFCLPFWKGDNFSWNEYSSWFMNPFSRRDSFPFPAGKGGKCFLVWVISHGGASFQFKGYGSYSREATQHCFCLWSQKRGLL